VAEPGREGGDLSALLRVPGCCIDLEDPRVFTSGLPKIVAKDMAILQLLDPVGNAEAAIICMDE